MSLANPEMIAQLMTFDKKGQGDEIINENVRLEVTNATADGYVEIAFTDRNERYYLQFSLPEFLTHICRQGMK
jgi:hypothetical protein